MRGAELLDRRASTRGEIQMLRLYNLPAAATIGGSSDRESRAAKLRDQIVQSRQTQVKAADVNLVAVNKRHR